MTQEVACFRFRIGIRAVYLRHLVGARDYSEEGSVQCRTVEQPNHGCLRVMVQAGDTAEYRSTTHSTCSTML